MSTIHPSASVSDQCSLGADVQIGAHCVVDGPVTLGDGVRLLGSVHIVGPVSIGAQTTVYPFVCIGFPAQDTKFKPGAATAGVRIGRGCVIREQVTIHAATSTDMPTSVGDRAFLLVGAHVGHDCVVGNDVTIVNCTQLSGHVSVGDRANLSGLVGVHQFVRIGELAFLAGGVAVSMDVPPYCRVDERNRLTGINAVGMRRAGIDREHITQVRQAFRQVLRPCLPREETIRMLSERASLSPTVGRLHEFITAPSRRGICPGPARPPRSISSWLSMSRRRPELLCPDDSQAQRLEV